MQKIAWTEEFSVGVPVIDEQHKRLIGMLISIVDASGGIFNIIMQMYAYADEHFQSEEAMMRRHGYAGLEQHIRAHRDFSEKATSFADRDYSQGVAREELFSYLRKWLTKHILKVDMAYKDCVAGADPTPDQHATG